MTEEWSPVIVLHDQTGVDSWVPALLSVSMTQTVMKDRSVAIEDVDFDVWILSVSSNEF